MAPRPIHEPPHVQLSRLAREARREGLSFERFWSRAVREHRPLVMTNHPEPPDGAVRWPTDRSDRRAWQAAIYSSREGWQRAYEGLPAPICERSLAMLAEAFAVLDAAATVVGSDEPIGVAA